MSGNPRAEPLLTLTKASSKSRAHSLKTINLPPKSALILPRSLLLSKSQAAAAPDRIRARTGLLRPLPKPVGRSRAPLKLPALQHPLPTTDNSKPLSPLPRQKSQSPRTRSLANLTAHASLTQQCKNSKGNSSQTLPRTRPRSIVLRLELESASAIKLR